MTGIVLVCFAVGIELPGGSDDIIAAGAIPRVLIVLSYLALSGAAATLAAGAVCEGATWRRVTLVFVALLGAAMAGKTIEAAKLIDTFRLVIQGRELVPAAVPDVLAALGWVALGGAVAIGVAPVRVARRLGRWWPLLAAIPFVIGLCAYLVAAFATARGSGVPGVPQADAVVASAIVALLFGIGFANAGLLFWQAAMGARAARDASTPVAVRLGARPRALEALVGAKLLWVVLGLVGVLPALLGGGEDRWDASRGDGIFAWAFVAALLAAAGFWLVRDRGDRLQGTGLIAAVAAITAGLLVALLLGAGALFGNGVASVAPGSWTQRAFFDAGNWLADRIVLTQVITVAVAAPAAAVLVARARTTVSVFLALFAVWAIPRTICVAWEELADRPVSWGRVDLITFDVGLTVLAAVLLVLARSGRVTIDRALLALMLLVSTALAHAPWLLGAISETAAFYVGLLFAPLYLFVFGAAKLNEPGEDRAARVLRATGLAAGVLTLVTVQVAAETLAPGKSSVGEFARLLIAVPMAAVLIASERAGAPATVSMPTPRTSPRTGPESSPAQ